MGTQISKADVSMIRERLDEVRDINDFGRRKGEAERVIRTAMHARHLISEETRGDLRASEQRMHDELSAIAAEAESLVDERRLTDAREDVVFSELNRRGADSPELRQAFDTFLRTGESGELRAMGVGTGAGGGFSVPEGFRRKLTETLKAHGGVRSVAEVVTTDDGADLPWATNDDTGNAGAILAENTATTDVDLTLGQKQLGSFMYDSKIVKISIQLAQDNGIDLEGRLARILGQRVHRAQSPHFATGAGTTEPQGLVTGGTVGVTGATGQTDSVTYDDLVDLVHSVDPAYRENADENVWLMNDSTFKTVRKIKDADGRPLVEPDVKRGAPNSILGHRVVIDQGLPSMAASAKSIAFGNIRAGYVIRDVRGVSVVRFNERYMDALQLGFLAFMRSDGLVQDASAFKLYENAAS